MDLSHYIGRKFGAFEITEVLGIGGQSIVFRARQTTVERDVALKVMPKALSGSVTFVKQFKREAEITAQLNHPHVAPIFDFGEADGQYYIAMKLLTGGSMRDKLVQSPQPQGDQLTFFVTVLRTIAQVIDYLHTQDVVHRNIKPSNILFDADQSPYLVDFGIAKYTAILRVTEHFITSGTPGYVAPEQLLDQAAHPSTDLYALAVTAFQVLAGRLPFDGTTPMAVLHQQLTQRPPSLHVLREDIPPSASAVLDRALAKRPVDRYATAEQFVDALESALAELLTPGTKHIFISYSRKNTDTMHQVRDCLRAQQISVWTDDQLMPGTPGWEAAIADAIEHAAALVVILSPAAKKSTWVARELSYAEDLGVRIFPVLLEGDVRSAVPFRLASTQRIDVADDLDHALQQLIEVLNAHFADQT